MREEGRQTCQLGTTFRYVGGTQAEWLDLAVDGIGFIEEEAAGLDDLSAQAFDGMRHVHEADAGVYHYEPARVFQKKAVAHGTGIRGACR